MSSEYYIVHLPAVCALILAAYLQTWFITLFTVMILLYALLISALFLPKSLDDAMQLTKQKGGRGKESEESTDFAVDISQIRFKDGKTQYCISLFYQGVDWSTWRSYSEILEFHERHPPKESSAVPFPEKSSVIEYLFGGDKTIQFVEDRKAKLRKVLQNVLDSKEQFEVVVSLNKDEKTGKSPSGIFLGVPDIIDLKDIKLGPSRQYLLDEGIKGLRLAYEHVQKVRGDGVEPWKIFNKSNDGIWLYFFEDGARMNSGVRAECGAGVIDMIDFLTDAEERVKWDKDFAGQTVIEWLTLTDEEANATKDLGFKLLAGRVIHTKTSSPARMIISDRDTLNVALVARRESDGAIFLALRSIEDNRAPPPGANGFVRAEVICSGTLLEPIPGKNDACVFTLAGETDLKANVPKSFVKMFAPKKAADVARFGELARERALRKKSTIKQYL